MAKSSKRLGEGELGPLGDSSGPTFSHTDDALRSNWTNSTLLREELSRDPME